MSISVSLCRALIVQIHYRTLLKSPHHNKKRVLTLLGTQHLPACKCVAKTVFATEAMINEEYALFSYSNICFYGPDSCLFSPLSVFFFLQQSQINKLQCSLYTKLAFFKMTAIGKLGIFKIRTEKRIRFIVGIAIWFFLEGSCRRN